jgi:hypothetical protein
MNMMIGFPGEQDHEAKASIQLARELHPKRVSVSVFTAYEGVPKAKDLPSIGINDYASQFHTNPRLMGFSDVKPETLQEMLALEDELGWSIKETH